ncbi:chaplin family protein [Nocardiopsis sp. NPDC057823]|uniref:chaplin family protein n=1 Tax=Nocardiopsis sp. NPDC057823 TaxID=3346256 RepID=UPI00366E0EB0
MTHRTHARIAALTAAGLLALAPAGTTLADTSTSGNGSIAGGNQLHADLDAPVDVCGNSLALLGAAGAQCAGGDAGTGGGVPDRDGDKGHPGYPGYSPEPSESPSEGPSEGPSESPSEGPSESPSEGPSEEPSESPSESPSEGPSEGPSESPSEGPEEGESPGEPSDSSTAGERPSDTSDARLPLTGSAGLPGLVIAAIAAAVAGIGLVIAGRRRSRI